MSEAYDYVKRELNSSRADLMFKPEMLDQLSDNERPEIENLIMAECKRGNVSSFKYLPYLKRGVLMHDIPRETIEKFPDLQKAEVCRYLYKATKLFLYVDMLIEPAYHSPEVYSVLIQMYKEMEEGRVKQETGEIIFHIQKTKGEVYRELYEKRLVSEGVSLEPKKHELPPVPEDKKPMLEQMKAYRDKLLERMNSGQGKKM